MKRKIDSESLPLKNWKKEAAMFQDDYTAGAGTSWLLNVAKAENKMIWEMIRAIEEAPTLTQSNEALTLDNRLTPKMVTCPKGWEGVRNTRFYCPGCKKAVKKGEAYCHKCGQAILFPAERYDKENNKIWLDFSDCRPLEGEKDA